MQKQIDEIKDDVKEMRDNHLAHALEDITHLKVNLAALKATVAAHGRLLWLILGVVVTTLFTQIFK